MARQKASAVNWDLFSKNRALLMGFSIVLIIVFHWAENFSLLLDYTPPLLYPLVKQGSTGVEMFLFLSGIGLYFSFTRNSNLKDFYVKRFVQILVPYLMIAAPYQIWQDFFYTDHGISGFLADLSMVTTFLPFNRQGWYVALILILYLLFPLFYAIIKRFSTPGFAVLELLFLALPLAVQIYNEPLFNLIQIALTRIPTFLLGVYCGRFVYEKKPLRVFPWLMAALYLFFTAANLYGKSLGLRTTVAVRYQRASLALLILLVVALILQRFPLPRVKAFFTFAAPMTLELYLAHVQVRRMFPRLFKGSWTASSVNLAYVSIIAISVPVAYFVHEKSKPVIASLLRRFSSAPPKETN